MRIYISGQKAFGASVYCLAKELGHEVIGVSAPRRSSSGKGWDRLRAIALGHGVPVLESGQLKASTLPDNIDLIIAAHSYDFISEKTRAKTKLGAIGYHPSLLPLHRGRDAVRWAIRMNDRVTGGSVYWLNNNIDGGDIAAQSHIFISPADTPETLWREQLFDLGVTLFRKVLGDLSRGVIVAIPQDNALATWEPSIDRPPVFRPDLPRLGAIDGYTVIANMSASLK